MNAQVVINQKDDRTWSLMIDGQEIADAVAACSVMINGVGRPAHVRISLLELTAFSGKADAVLAPEQRAALIALGWKAPE